jgi:hypothetical protein
MSVEVVEHGGIRLAEIIWAETRVSTTTFFSPPESSFQFGLLAHDAGFVEAPHRHHAFEREIRDLQQMLVVQRGALAIELYDDEGGLLREVVLRAGDAIVLIQGVHGLRVLEDMQCLTVKQGPFLGTERDKIPVETKPRAESGNR